ncbi:hypothetical protein K7X08_022303 [Anisodus acutangulus]|uniref:Protein FAM32A-like n=1 Tax=Anisodus acutangulus TaxID=402998 RepID=A0A9Q1RHI0_9SOLA|nr:hypothetical protein K7X08_022303 [Anisodus acutangulus]
MPAYSLLSEMSAYDNVVGGKLKLKGKALDVKAAGIKKKKKKEKKDYVQISQVTENEFPIDGDSGSVDDSTKEESRDATKSVGEENAGRWDDHLTPAERRYIEQRERIDMHKMTKTANKSHRDRIEDFNQYLANMSEHYDIPKVGPG